MNTHAMFKSHRAGLRGIHAAGAALKRARMLLLAVGALLCAATTSAAVVDGRHIPSWSSSRITLPDLSFENAWYSVELSLVSGGSNPVLQVTDLRLASNVAADATPYDGAARYADNLLSIPVFESNGLYYSAVLEPVATFASTPQRFRVKDMWQVLPGRLDVPLTGLDYSSGAVSGLTDSQGRFYAAAGQQVRFSVGALELGSAVAAASGTTTWASLFAQGEADTSYQRSLQVLGLLDADSNSVNGIRITAAMKQSITPVLIGMDLAASGFDSQYVALTAAARNVNPAALSYDAPAAVINFQKLEIQTYMLARLAEKSIPGVTLSIELPNGELWHTAAGLANTVTGEAMTPLHQFRIGSATKSFTGMLIMQLVDEGKLSLTQKLEEFFPGRFPHGDEITIKMLLNHTAGIFSFTNEFPGFQQVYGITLDQQPKITDLWFVRYIGMPGFVYKPGELVTIGATANSDFDKNNATETKPYLVNAPGTQWNYSNTHYVLLQEIAETLTGNSWEHEIRTRFVEPLGLTHTIVPSAGDLLLQGTYAHGYINWADNQGAEVADLFGFPRTDVDRTNTDPSYTMGSGAMISTAADLTIWANAVMEGELLSPATQALMREPFEVTSAFGENINMLQGVVQDLNLQVFGHRGQIAGYDASWQYHYRDPNDVIGTGTAMAVLLNRTLLTEYNPDGSPHISDVNEVMLEGILDILYGAE